MGRFRSGSAQISVVNTAMVGMVCGNAIANVTMTGPYCIDNMKKNGYNPTTATAISCVGSNGGQILPPVMGIVAFSMAGYAGIPYWTICKMAIISAILYYLSLSLYAHLHALKTPELRTRIVEKPVVDWDVMKWKGPAFVVPFIIIITLLIQGKSVMVCGFWAIISVIVMSYLAPKRHRPKFRELIGGFVEGAKQGAQMGACCAVIGMLVCTFTTSGMGVKLTSGIESWSHGSLFLALLILYIASIIAGMAGVSVAAYFTAAAFAVPALQKLGIAYATAHFFCVYPASYSTITPPVALTTLVGTQISGTPYGKTAIECCKICGVSFLAPFLFCICTGSAAGGKPDGSYLLYPAPGGHCTYRRGAVLLGKLFLYGPYTAGAGDVFPQLPDIDSLYLYEHEYIVHHWPGALCSCHGVSRSKMEKE